VAPATADRDAGAEAAGGPGTPGYSI
jgi:hypothetical protein